MDNHLPVQKQKSVDGDQIAPSAKTKKKTGMETPRNSYKCNHSPAEDPDDTSTVPPELSETPNPELPETLDLSEIQSEDT